MSRKILGACLFAGSCLAMAAAALVKVTPTDPVAVPVAYAPIPSAADAQMVVGLRSDRLALPPIDPPAAAPVPVDAPSLVPPDQTQLLNAQAMASPAEVEHETAAPRRHHTETRNSARHRPRPHAVAQLPEAAKTDTGGKDKTAEIACANGNGFLRALNLAPACN